MLKESVFKNESVDCMYFKFSMNSKKINGLDNRILKDKIKIKVLEAGESRIDNKDMLLLDKKFNDLNPVKDDMIYLNRNMYKIDNVMFTEEEEVYLLKVSKYESILSI